MLDELLSTDGAADLEHLRSVEAYKNEQEAETGTYLDRQG